VTNRKVAVSRAMRLIGHLITGVHRTCNAFRRTIRNSGGSSND
jgi:hypothetical protein